MSYEKFVKNQLSTHDPDEMLDLAVYGLTGEVGEFVDLLKKKKFHNKPTDENHLKSELGDILFYLTTACLCYNITLDDLKDINTQKLKKRFPNGTFDAEIANNKLSSDY